MKKIIVILILPLMILLLSCTTKRMDIAKLTFKSIDYNGGYTYNYVFDFLNNEYKKTSYMYGEDVDLNVIRELSFTDEEKLELINGINDSGLLGIKEEYKKDGIIDGGGWNLTIEFEDGTSFKSRGDNASPKEVFNKCATFFYDLCGEGVVGQVPEYYSTPVNVSTFFCYKREDNVNVNSMGLARVQLGNYKWNKFSSSDNDYYLMNLESKEYSDFQDNYKYKLFLYTANYFYEKKFNKIEVFEFDFNSELSNKKTIYTGKWFKQIEIDLSLNKIYIYRLSYKDGNYSEFTFNTFINN